MDLVSCVFVFGESLNFVLVTPKHQAQLQPTPALSQCLDRCQPSLSVAVSLCTASASVCLYVCVCVCECVRACVRARARVRVCVCVCIVSDWRGRTTVRNDKTTHCVCHYFTTHVILASPLLMTFFLRLFSV